MDYAVSIRLKWKKWKKIGNLNQYSYVGYSYISKIIFLLTCVLTYKGGVG